MKKFGFALVGATALALAGCSGSNDDSLNNVDTTNTADLNGLANEAANAAEAEALGVQQEQLEQENNSVAADDLNASSNSEAEENVSGM